MGQGDSDGWGHFTTDTTRKGTHENVLLTLIEPLRCVQLCLAIKSAHTVDMKLEKKIISFNFSFILPWFVYLYKNFKWSKVQKGHRMLSVLHSFKKQRSTKTW